MSNAIYPLFKKALLSGGGPDLLSVDVKVALIDTDVYVYDAAHEFMADVPSGAVIAISPVLAGKTISDLAAFNSTDPVFPAVTGAQSEALILFIDTGVDATSRLIAFQDTGVTGLPTWLPIGALAITTAVSRERGSSTSTGAARQPRSTGGPMDLRDRGWDIC